MNQMTAKKPKAKLDTSTSTQNLTFSYKQKLNDSMHDEFPVRLESSLRTKCDLRGLPPIPKRKGA
jgi:hypothetical protein